MPCYNHEQARGRVFSCEHDEGQRGLRRSTAFEDSPLRGDCENLNIMCCLDIWGKLGGPFTGLTISISVDKDPWTNCPPHH
jgi:hypothetical protein